MGAALVVVLLGLFVGYMMLLGAFLMVCLSARVNKRRVRELQAAIGDLKHQHAEDAHKLFQSDIALKAAHRQLGSMGKSVEAVPYEPTINDLAADQFWPEEIEG